MKAALAVLAMFVLLTAGGTARADLAPSRVVIGPQVVVTTPTAGQSVTLNSVCVIQFTAKNWDTSQSYRYMPELLRGGTVLGAVNGVGFPLSPTSTSVGVNAGKYLVNTATQIGMEKSAAAATGYSYRITVYRGTWGQHTVIAAGTSPTFSLVLPPPPPVPPAVTVTTPTAGTVAHAQQRIRGAVPGEELGHHQIASLHARLDARRDGDRRGQRRWLLARHDLDVRRRERRQVSRQHGHADRRR
jgi:hypothetical protein